MRRISLVLLVAVLAACNTIPDVTDGKRLMAEGRIDEGLALLEQTARAHPGSVEARNAYITQRDRIVNVYVREGDQLRTWGELDAAEVNYRRALQIDPGSPLAQAGLDALARDRRNVARVREAEELLKRGDYAGAERIARAVLAENSSQRGARDVMKRVAERRARAESEGPALKSAFTRPISLEFRDAPIRSVFE